MDAYTTDNADKEEDMISENQQQPQESTTTYLNEDENKEIAEADNEEIQLAVIKDETVDTMTKLIIDTLSWTNAALFQAAISNTFYIAHWDNLENSWFLFVISLIMAVSFTILPLFCADTKSKSFSKELIADDDDDNPQFLDTERPFGSRFEYLLRTSLALVVSMTLRDAARLTFQQKVIEQANIDTAAYMLGIYQ